MEARVKRYEPPGALFAGQEGLDFFRVISKRLPDLLRRGGKLFVEFGRGQEESIKDAFSDFNNQKVIKDLSGKERFFYGSDYRD